MEARMHKKKRVTKARKDFLTADEARRLKAAAIEVFEEAEKLDLKLRALAKAAHVLSVPFKY
jgi:hypothetical protein